MTHLRNRVLRGAFNVFVIAMMSATTVFAQMDDPHAGHNHAPGEGHAEEDNSPVLYKVNGQEITQAQVEGRVNQMLMQSQQMGQVANADQLNELRETLREQAEKTLIDQAIFDSARQKELDNVKDEVIEERIQKLSAEMQSQGQSLEDMMAQMGDTMEDLRKQIRTEFAGYLLAEKLVDFKGPTQEEARAMFEQYKGQMGQPETAHTRHILLGYEGNARDPNFKPAEGEKEKLKAEAEKVHKRVTEGGEDFAEVAKEVSTGPSAPQGGDIGAYPRGNLAPPYEEAAFSLKKDEISDVVETQFGFHIIQLIEKTEAAEPKFEDYEFQITEYLRSTKFQEVIPDLLDKLRPDAEIEEVNQAAMN